MPVPEAPMDQDDLSQPWEYQVRRSGQTAGMEAKSISESVGSTADDHFGPGILLSNSAHQGGPSRVDEAEDGVFLRPSTRLRLLATRLSHLMLASERPHKC